MALFTVMLAIVAAGLILWALIALAGLIPLALEALWIQCKLRRAERPKEEKHGRL